MYVASIGNNINPNLRIIISKNIVFGAKYLSFSDVDEKIKNGDFSEIENLPDLHIVNNKLDTLLHSSARSNQIEISKYLLKKGLNQTRKILMAKLRFQ